MLRAYQHGPLYPKNPVTRPLMGLTMGIVGRTAHFGRILDRVLAPLQSVGEAVEFFLQVGTLLIDRLPELKRKTVDYRLQT